MREVLLVIHILGAGTWLGANVTQLMVTPRLRDEGGAAAAAWMRSIHKMGTMLYTPAAVLLLITGVWLVIDSSVYDFEQVFVAIGVMMVIIGAVLGARVYGPKAESAAAAFQAGDDAAGSTIVARTSRVGAVETALLVTTIVAMVYRWGA